MELTNRQIVRQDFVDNSIFELINNINPTNHEIDWNIELISEVREQIQLIFIKKLAICDEQTFYPFIE
ncbi:MAG: hypothetical protein RIT27_1323 [Pseudomonadota bacterium]|jgi:hypothetical protein